MKIVSERTDFDPIRFRFKSLTHWPQLLITILSPNIVLERVVYITYVRSLNGIPQIEPKIRVRVRIGEFRDLKKLTKLVVSCPDFYLETLRRRHELGLIRRLRDGDICFLAENEKGDIVGMLWVVFRQSFVREWYRALSVKMQPREALLYDAFVVPQYRGNRIFEKLLEEALGFLGEKQYLRAYTQVSYENVPSTKSALRVGFRP